MFKASLYFFLGVILFAASPAQAQITVGGNAATCDFTDLQSAINAASTLNQVIHVAQDGNYTGQTYIVSNKPLVLRGGFANCQATEPAGRTVIDGDALVRPLEFSVTSGMFALTLENMVITGGVSPANGGGILVSGAATLRLRNSVVFDNQAEGDGGGVYMSGHTSQQLIIDDATAGVTGNQAQGNGGGVFCTGGASIFMPAGLVAQNQAYSGGAFYLNGCDLTVHASGPLQGLLLNVAHQQGSAIHARSGAMVRLDGGDRMHSAHDQPVVVGANTLEVTDESGGFGGAIYLSNSDAELIDTWVAENTGRATPTIYLQSNATLTMKHSPDGQCDLNGAMAGCSRIMGNAQTHTPNALITGLAVSTLLNATAHFERTIISHNQGSLASQIFQTSTSTSTTSTASITLDGVLIVDNQVRRIARMHNSDLDIAWSTIANNDVTDRELFWMSSSDGRSSDLNLRSAIVWEPAAETYLLLEGDGAVGIVDCVVTHDPAALVAGMDDPDEASGLTGANPQFFGSGHSPWRLTTESPAFGCNDDHYQGVPDLLGLPRGIGTPAIYTAGAYRAIIDALFHDRFESD